MADYPPIDLLPYAEASAAAYSCAPDFECADTDTQAIVYRHPDLGAILAFRGTTGVRDWETNFSTGFAALRDQVLVHEGSAAAWISVLEPIKNWIASERANSPGFRLRITGHSLGGQVATVCALDLAPRTDGITLVTFGAPRCFHRATPLHHRITSYRAVNNNDIVPRLPPERLGYAHRGRRLYFDESGAFHDVIGPFDELADRIEGRLADFGEPGTDGIKDHSMEQYLRLAARHSGPLL